MSHPSVAVDNPWQQRGVGPTPFASVMAPAPDHDAALATKSDAVQRDQCQPTRVAFNALRRPPECSAAYTHPPPTESTVSRSQPKPSAPADAPPPLPRDTLHPLVSAMQAAENAKAASLNPAVVYNANAARTGAPCEAHLAMGRRGQGGRDTGSSGPTRETRGGGSDDESGDGDEDDEYTGGVQQRQSAVRNSRRGDVNTAVGRAYNSEGAFHEPEVYSSNVVGFASSQPSKASEIAAKALASALHDSPSLAIPANAAAAANFRPKPNSGVLGPSVNRHLHAGLFGKPNAVLPPSPAFRQLPAHTKALLTNRPMDARAAAEMTVRDPEQGRVALETLPTSGEEGDALDRLLVAGGSCDLWEDALTRCGARVPCVDQPLPTSHAAVRTLPMRRLRVVNPQTVSMYTSQSSRPAVRELLGGCGLRMNDTLTQVKQPSQAGFLGDKSRAENVKQFTNIPYTPSNAYGFDSERFGRVLSESGLEVQEIQLDGAAHITTLGHIPEHCPNARIINLGGCKQLTTGVVEAIAKNCRALAFINLSNTDLPSGAVNCLLCNSSNLTTLCLSNLQQLNAEADLAWTMLMRHRHLRVLDISYCPEVTDVALASVAKFCPALEVLDFSGCFAVTDEGVRAVGTSLTALRVLRLAMCVGVSPEGLTHLAHAPRNVEVLDLSGCTTLSNDAVKEVTKRLREVRYLSLAGCTSINDEAVRSVALYCRNLKVLNLSSCVGVSRDSCMLLIHELPKLSRLVVSESSISNAEVVMLSSLRETCEIIRNQFRPVPLPTLIGYKAPEVKKPAKTDGKKGKK